MNQALTNLKRFNPPWSALKKTGEVLGKGFLLNPTDEIIRYKKTLCLALEKGEISAAVGTKCLSRLRLGGVKRYFFPESLFPPPSFLASSLDLALAELKVGKNSIILSIPKSWAVITTAEYPATVLENPAEVMAYELDRLTPFTPETAYYDFKVLRSQGERITLLVAAVRMEQIDPYLKVLREKGCRVEGITLSLLGLSTLHRYITKADHGLIVEIDKDRYEGVLFAADSSLEVFSGAFSEETESVKVERVMEEMALLKPSSGPQAPRNEYLIVLKDNNAALKEVLKMKLPSTVSFLDEADLGPGSWSRQGKQISFSAVGGLLESLWNKSWNVNLLRKGRHLEARPSWVMTLLVLLILGGLVGWYWTAPVEIETKKLQNLDKQIAARKLEIKKVANLKKDIESVSTEVNLINEFKRIRPLNLNILRELTALLPKNTWLTRIRVFEMQVHIEGYSPSATGLIPRLEGSKFFRKVEFAAPTFKDPRQNMDRFQIKMELKNP